MRFRESSDDAGDALGAIKSVDKYLNGAIIKNVETKTVIPPDQLNFGLSQTQKKEVV